MTNNALLGNLLSEHKLADSGRGALFTCGCFLILPFIFGLWGLIASLTYARDRRFTLPLRGRPCQTDEAVH